MAKCSVSSNHEQANLQFSNYFYFCFCCLLYLLSKWKKEYFVRRHCIVNNSSDEFLWKDKNTRHYSICYKNYCSKWTKEDFGYVKVHKIVLLLVPDMLS